MGWARVQGRIVSAQKSTGASFLFKLPLWKNFSVLKNTESILLCILHPGSPDLTSHIVTIMGAPDDNDQNQEINTDPLLFLTSLQKFRFCQSSQCSFPGPGSNWGSHLVFNFSASSVSFNLRWCLVFLCLSGRIQTTYVVDYPSVWVCLMVPGD